MLRLSTKELRSKFLKYFHENDHRIVESCSLVPQYDPTLLFINAGMAPFKKFFLNEASPPSAALVSSQRCLRAGGKHNDLDEVGFTFRHHTLFEMLGNFSFGAYSQERAIVLAWNFLTKELQLPTERLHVTFLEGEHRTEHMWKSVTGLPPSRLHAKDETDNFWAMGPTGPCGPCTEIFWDQGDHITDPEDRFLELWNLVFMEYNRTAENASSLQALPKPCIDTGMGLERVASVLQGVSSNFEIEVYQQLIEGIQHVVLAAGGRVEGKQFALRVLADHLRAASFLISDGVLPSTTGQGYVLRRILRRAFLYGHKLGLREPFFERVFPFVVQSFDGIEGDILRNGPTITQVITMEEKAFLEMLDRGLTELEKLMQQRHHHESSNEISAEIAFRLHDSFGFPVDLTQVICRENGKTVDLEGFDALMEEQKSRARADTQAKRIPSASGSGEPQHASSALEEWEKEHVEATFSGFTGNDLRQGTSVVRYSIVSSKAVEKEAIVVIDPCPFYAEGGGQVGDQGVLVFYSQDGGKEVGQLQVVDTIKPFEGGIVLKVTGSNLSFLEDKNLGVVAEVHRETRQATAVHHTATHLLHSALRNVLGAHATQAGSHVSPHRLRFDFTHGSALSSDELRRIETFVNDAAKGNDEVQTSEMAIEEAQRSGAMANFGEKYGDVVRVVKVGAVSSELCGGTHVQRSGEVFPFCIRSQGSVSSGIRRIEAVAGHKCVEFLQERNNVLECVSQELNVKPEKLQARIAKFGAQIKDVDRQNQMLMDRLARVSYCAPVEGKLSNGLPFRVHQYEPSTAESTKADSVIDMQLLRKHAQFVAKDQPDVVHVVKMAENVVCAVHRSGKVSIDESESPSAKDVLLKIFQSGGGSGGGRQQFAQGKLTRREATVHEIHALLSAP